MKTSADVTPEKLRGGFYTPEALVRVCLDRVASLTEGSLGLRLLEPSAGDGAFVRGLAAHGLHDRISHLTAVELLDSEAAACARALQEARVPGEVRNQSVLDWFCEGADDYDAAVGNPPFVRFQFVSPEDRRRSEDLHFSMGLPSSGVSNLWIPVFLGTLKALRPGGVYSFVVPAEVLTGVSAHTVRQWLVEHTHRIYLDLFAPGSFPGVLQEVVVISGRRSDDRLKPTRELHIREERETGASSWRHTIPSGIRTWTRYLLTGDQVAALAEAEDLVNVRPLAELARLEVSTVTGANDFFCVDEATLRRHSLRPWARSLLPRTRHAPGLRFTAADHADLTQAGEKAWLLDFSTERPNPAALSAVQDYLDLGAAQALPTRFKCRIREPWYRVPVVTPGELLMAKRSHLFPRLIVNEAGVVTTDTIYRGRILRGSPLSAGDLAASFHNSLTILTAEVEGRSFGGGVLELVPSEIARLLVPVSGRIGLELDRLDWVTRTRGRFEDEALIDETDELVVKHVQGISARLMSTLREARENLLARRLART